MEASKKKGGGGGPFSEVPKTRTIAFWGIELEGAPRLDILKTNLTLPYITSNTNCVAVEP